MKKVSREAAKWLKNDFNATSKTYNDERSRSSIVMFWLDATLKIRKMKKMSKSDITRELLTWVLPRDAKPAYNSTILTLADALYKLGQYKLAADNYHHIVWLRKIWQFVNDDDYNNAKNGYERSMNKLRELQRQSGDLFNYEVEIRPTF
jgi:hypothetical protein